MSKKIGVLRARKDGTGCSLCRASDENVGKRRCNHILSNVSMTVRKEGSTNFVNIDGKMNNKNTSFSIESSTDEIKSYISSLSAGLKKKEKDAILDTLRNMNNI